MKHSVAVKRLSALVLAVVFAALVFAGCGASVPKELTESLEKAQTSVTEFARERRRNVAIFTHELFTTANEAAAKLGDDTSDEALEKVKNDLSLDSITIGDENRVVIASTEKDEVGKKLKEIEEKKRFADIASYNAIEMITDPMPTGNPGEYSYLVGVHRADGTGVVIVGITTEEYAKVSGETLANELGENIVIVKDGAVFSSSLSGVNVGDTLDALGVTSDMLSKGNFSITVDGKKYQCVSAVSGDYTVICAIAA